MGHGDGTYQTDPIDDLDKICYVHDLCYDDNQYNDCLCDYNFVKSMREVGATVTPDLRNKANLMASWFEGSACACFAEDGKVSNLEGPGNFDAKGKCMTKLATMGKRAQGMEAVRQAMRRKRERDEL